MLEGKENFKRGQYLISWKGETFQGSFPEGNPNQSFHIASVGKLFTLSLVKILEEEKRLRLTDPIHKYLSKDVLDSLFVFEGKDYQKEVTIEQLLDHTSGVADYFESKGIDGSDFMEVIKSNPQKRFSPLELIAYTQKEQKAAFPPGKGFLYSDTGYILLGLIIESVAKESYEIVLEKKIFLPLGMKASYMYKRSRPLDVTKENDISPIFLGAVDVTQFESVTADWAGGGIVSTTGDLLLFQKALWQGKLFQSAKPIDFAGKQVFHDGIFYGRGWMTVDYGDLFFLFKGTPLMQGHSGILSTLCFYNPELDLHVIANFGGTEQLETSFRWMLQVVQMVEKMQKQ
ncbi:beta-lactamase [Leptospira ryugenii]|uniref:Beta-lactamase n=2 Tax=Leptospira ryugenii TaxID=1917863 RepID=A0A2P2DXF2_9LEPT|nr:beta-lactamase [Leptospira ryugenii]